MGGSWIGFDHHVQLGIGLKTEMAGSSLSLFLVDCCRWFDEEKAAEAGVPKAVFKEELSDAVGRSCKILHSPFQILSH